MKQNNNVDYMLEGDTGNSFRFFNIKNLSTCYEFYEEFVQSMISKLEPENNPYNKKDSKPLQFIYNWSDKFNASASENKVDKITLNEGIIIEVYSFFYKLVNKGCPLPPLSGALIPHILIESELTYTNDKYPEKSINGLFFLSNDPHRNNLAEWLAMFAIKWIIAHEIGHIYNGHTKYYLETRKKITELTPIKDDEKLKQYYLDLQTMEMDADTFASNRIMEEAIELYYKSQNVIDLQNPLDFLKLPIFAIHGIFYICRDYRKKDSFNTEHPPAFIRELMSIGAAEETLKNLDIGINNISEFLLSDIRTLDQTISFVNKNNDDNFLKYVEEFCIDATEWSELISDNYFKRISHILKEESRLPIEGLDY